MADAACKNESSDLFFPSKGKNTRQAKKLCAECPVRGECSDYAVRTGSVGMWAGESRRLGTEGQDVVTGEATSTMRSLDDMLELRRSNAS